MPSSKNIFFRTTAQCLAVAGLYFLGAGVGLQLGIPPSNVTPFWPPSGVAIAAVLFFGNRVLPGVWLGSFLGNAWASQADPSSEFAMRMIVSAFFGAGASLQAYVGALLLRKKEPSGNPVLTANTFLFFALIVAPVGCLISSTIGTSALVLGGIIPPASTTLVWFTFWLGDTTGVLVFAPLLLAWRGTEPIIKNLRTLPMATLVFVTLIIVGQAAFGQLIVKFVNYPLAFLPFPILVILAFKYKQRGAVAASFLLSSIAVLGTVRGTSPFSTYDPHEGLLLCQLYIACAVIMTILLSALTDELTKVRDTSKQAASRAKLANKEKSQFLTGMSHEIRTPLTAIMGYCDLALRETDATRQRDYLDRTRRNGQHLLSLINNILDLSKIENGKLETTNEVFDLKEEVLNTLSMFEAEATTKKIGLSLTIDTDVPKEINLDPLRLRQILINLIGNSMKFTDEGQISVEVKRADDGHILFTIQDTGKGIPADQHDEVFKPSSQVSNTRNCGAGLGLAISRKLAEKLGGQLTLVHSEPELGSRFQLSVLPAPTDRHVIIGSPEKSSDVGGLRLESTRVLLVEDSEDIRTLVSHILRTAGAEILIAKDGIEGIEAALTEDVDLVLMDLQMPRLDGYGALHELRKQNFVKPIIALTAFALDQERERCLNSGFDGYLAKPLAPDTLIKTVLSYSMVVHKPKGRANYLAPQPRLRS